MRVTGRQIASAAISAGVLLSLSVLGSAEDNNTTASGGRDGQIDSRVEFRLRHDEKLKDQKIKVDVKEKTVILKGTVASETDKARAESLASLKSVKRVDNRIEVEGGATSEGRAQTPAEQEPQVVNDPDRLSDAP